MWAWETAAWESCIDCGGARVQGEHCLAHLSDSEFDREIARLRRGEDLDARGVEISGALLGRVLDELTPGSDCPPELPSCNFAYAHFVGEADFRGARFRDAGFRDVHFSTTAVFAGARFADDAIFFGARFCGDAQFSGTKFGGWAGFRGATFSAAAVFTPGVEVSGHAAFEFAEFSDGAMFHGAHFLGNVSFSGVRFLGAAYFKEAQFSGTPVVPIESIGEAWTSQVAQFSGTQFAGSVDFLRAGFWGDVAFEEATFGARVTFGPVVVAGTLSFDRAEFEGDIQLNASAWTVSCRRTRFGEPANLNLRWAEIALDDARFVQRSRVAGVAMFADVDETPARSCRLDRRLEATPRPRLLSLRQANVENLTLGNVDLRACRFFGAHGLDQLRIEADCDFAQPPSRWRYTRRLTLAEEHHWRAQRRRGRLSSRRDQHEWHPGPCQPAADSMPAAVVLEPPQIAAVYRALRKALEDRKDEPGAADFYYGEMEMRRVRRQAEPRPAARATRDHGERGILTLYWLVSGYGLRASRALICLAISVAGAAGLLSWFGFRHGYPYDPPYDRSYWWALLFAMEGAVSLLRAPQLKLTAAGEVVQITLRILGPLFVGLALLALRGRVKR